MFLTGKTKPKIIFPKPSVEDILGDITAFIMSQSLELRFQDKLNQRKKLAEVLKQLSKTGDITEAQLISLIRSDAEAINVIISILGMSQEEFFRIVTLIRVLENSFDSEWKIKKIFQMIKNDDVFARKIANLLLYGKDDTQLAKHVPKFALDKLDKNKLLLNLDALIDSLIKAGLKGAYDEAKGDEAANRIAKILNELKVPYVSDVKVPNLDRKMDFVIPDLRDPHIFVEVGVFVTTARELSEKGLVEMRIRTQVEQHYPRSVLVRVIDGIGWLARGGMALPMIINASDYIITFNQIDKLRDIVVAHVPKQYFTTALLGLSGG